jgi:hypothetical protein
MGARLRVSRNAKQQRDGAAQQRAQRGERSRRQAGAAMSVRAGTQRQAQGTVHEQPRDSATGQKASTEQQQGGTPTKWKAEAVAQPGAMEERPERGGTPHDTPSTLREHRTQAHDAAEHTWHQQEQQRAYCMRARTTQVMADAEQQPAGAAGAAQSNADIDKNINKGTWSRLAETEVNILKKAVAYFNKPETQKNIGIVAAYTAEDVQGLKTDGGRHAMLSVYNNIKGAALPNLIWVLIKTEEYIKITEEMAPGYIAEAVNSTAQEGEGNDVKKPVSLCLFCVGSDPPTPTTETVKLKSSMCLL